MNVNPTHFDRKVNADGIDAATIAAAQAEANLMKWITLDQQQVIKNLKLVKIYSFMCFIGPAQSIRPHSDDRWSPKCCPRGNTICNEYRCCDLFSLMLARGVIIIMTMILKWRSLRNDV